MRLIDSFEVSAPVERAWHLLNDIPKVVPCMPGAELIETTGENSWNALVHVKLGPIGLQFTTDVTRENIDQESLRVLLTAKARELRGRGGAQATIESTLSSALVGTRVDIVTDLNLQGAVAQYGRGIVPDVASQLTRQFAENLAALLEPRGDASLPKTEIAPVSGVRLALRSLWQSIRRTFTRR